MKSHLTLRSQGTLTPLDVSGQVCGSSRGDYQPSVSNKILKEEVLASHSDFANGFQTDGPDVPSDCL